MRLEKAKGPIAAAREGERGTKLKGGGGDQKSNTGKTPKQIIFHTLPFDEKQIEEVVRTLVVTLEEIA